MNPELITWIVIVFAAGGAGKFMGLVMPGGALGLVGNPIVGIVGGIIAAQAGWGLGIMPEMVGTVATTDYVIAGVIGFVGGAILVGGLAMLRKGKP